MPRARSKSASKTASRTSAPKTGGRTRKATTKRVAASRPAASGTFVCPECGKSFTRAASLGAHRNRAHGVAGGTARRGTTRAATRSTTSARSATARPRKPLNRDALLAALFPNGIPARESVIRDVNAWLDQAEKLAGRA